MCESNWTDCRQSGSYPRFVPKCLINVEIGADPLPKNSRWSRHLAVVAVFVGEEHAVGVALREDAGLLEGDGRADASIFADDAEAAFGGAIVVRAAVEQHAASALGAILFWEHEVLFSGFSPKTQERVSLCATTVISPHPIFR